MLTTGFWFAICLLNAASAAAWGAGRVTEGIGALCFTVFVANIVFSAPGGTGLGVDIKVPIVMWGLPRGRGCVNRVGWIEGVRTTGA